MAVDIIEEIHSEAGYIQITTKDSIQTFSIKKIHRPYINRKIRRLSIRINGYYHEEYEYTYDEDMEKTVAKAIGDAYKIIYKKIGE